MAFSSTNPQISYHARSNSLPSKSHPLITQVDEQICRLRDSQAASTSSSISHKLSGLQDLHECIDKLLLMKFSRQALAQEGHQKLVDELLDGSLRLLDVSTTAKDALSQTKQCGLELQSAIRRKVGGEIGLASDARKYLTSRKVVKKTIQRALKNLNVLEKTCTFSAIENNSEIVSLISMLKEAEATTSAVLKSLLYFISGSKAQSNTSHWPLVFKLIPNKKVECEEESNEFAMLDTALESLIACKYDYVKINESAQKKLKDLDLCLQDLEEGIEFLFRGMIKTRVSLLNIFN